MTITAKIIADSISSGNYRLTTMQLRYPRFIHAEFMTHRVFSRNASSSRAIPVKRLIEDIINDPVYPSYWGSNKPGMQAGEECDAKIIIPATIISGAFEQRLSREQSWCIARTRAIAMAKAFDAAGYHKQIVNRLLEPFSHINVVVTATEWSNFYALRCHPDAQPEIQLLAKTMFKAQQSSTPQDLMHGDWHLPYVNETHDDLLDLDIAEKDKNVAMIKLSVARCARVSYLTHDGKPPNVLDDLRLYDRLVGSTPLHASPAEHQATPDKHPFTGASVLTDSNAWANEHQHGNFKGWIQFRKTLPNESQ